MVPPPPPVPRVSVSLADATREPHHYILPVGLISKIPGNEVTVRAERKSRPLDKGDFLWISETGLPLGAIAEVTLPALVPRFVKDVHYLIKLGPADELPSGICVDAAVSCVLQYVDHDHVVNKKDLTEGANVTAF